MPFEFKLRKSHFVDHCPVSRPTRSGLTSDPDTLLAIFDSIEQSIAENVRGEELHTVSGGLEILR